VGAFGTLVGAGGGFVLVPVLLFLYPEMKAGTVTSISLLVVTANAASGSIAYGIQRRIDIRSGILFACSTLPGAIAGSLVVGHVPRRQFDLMFAVVLGAVGVWLILWRPSTAIRTPVQGWGVVHREVKDRHGDTYSYSFRLWLGMLFSLGVGFFSSLLGVGGGFIHVPIMTAILHFPVHVATATSQFVLGFVAFEGSTVHVANGDIGWDDNLSKAGILAVGAILGAQAGARLSRRLPARTITRILAVTLVIVAARLGITAL
jgi:uncharacterized membrane protein YfcA